MTGGWLVIATDSTGRIVEITQRQTLEESLWAIAYSVLRPDEDVRLAYDLISRCFAQAQSWDRFGFHQQGSALRFGIAPISVGVTIAEGQ